MASTYDPWPRPPSTTWVPEFPRTDPFYPYQEQVVPPGVTTLPQRDVRDEWLIFVKIALDMYGVRIDYCASCGRSRFEYYPHEPECPLRPAWTGKYRESASADRAMRADDV